MAYDSIAASLDAQARLRPEEPAYFNKVGGRWRGTRWREYAAESESASTQEAFPASERRGSTMARATARSACSAGSTSARSRAPRA